MRPRSPELRWKALPDSDASPALQSIASAPIAEAVQPPAPDPREPVRPCADRRELATENPFSLETPVVIPEVATAQETTVRGQEERRARQERNERQAQNEKHDRMAMAFLGASQRSIRPRRIQRSNEPTVTSKVHDMPSSPETLRWRSSLRRVVWGVVGVAAIFTVAGSVKSAMARNGEEPTDSFSAAGGLHAVVPSQSLPATTPATAVLPVAPSDATERAQVAAPSEAIRPESTSATPTTEGATPSVSTGTGAASEATPAVKEHGAPEPGADPTGEPEKTVDPAKAKDLARRALLLLEAGNYKGTIETSEASIEADPSDASAYLYWGTALMEQGKRKEARDVFSRCVETATHGPKHECRQFR